MISTTLVRERPSLLPHAHSDTLIHSRLRHPSTEVWPDKLKVTTVDISLLLKPRDDDVQIASEAGYSQIKPSSTPGTLTVAGSPIPPTQSSSPSTSSTTATSVAPLPRPSFATLNNNSSAGLPSTSSSIPAKRPCRNFDQQASESPAKKQSKWSAEEDAKIIQLRGDGMKWEDISKHLPGRSAISCRLHYQNYLERRSEWDEDRKNKLARLYERFKSDMWSRIAEEMAIPWRAAEAMHWQMGEQEMARRAGVTPFSLTTNLNQQHTSAHNPVNGLSQNARQSAHMRSGSNPPRLRRDSQGVPNGFGGAVPNGSSSLMPPQLPSLAELTAGLPAYSNASSVGHPSPPMLTPPHHMYTHSGSSSYPFHQSRYNTAPSGPPPMPIASGPQSHSSRP